MIEQVPCFQLGFEFLNVENSEDFVKGLRKRWHVMLLRIYLHLVKVALIFCLKYCYRHALIILENE